MATLPIWCPFCTSTTIGSPVYSSMPLELRKNSFLPPLKRTSTTSNTGSATTISLSQSKLFNLLQPPVAQPPDFPHPPSPVVLHPPDPHELHAMIFSGLYQVHNAPMYKYSHF